MNFDNRLRKTDYYVGDVDMEAGKAFITQLHYSKGCSRTAVFMHGLFESITDEMVGVCQWLPPTKPAARSVNRDYWQKVLSLSRMVVHPGVPKNACSFMLGRSIRLIKQDPRWSTLLTYADSRVGHEGMVYAACNFTYLGVMPGSPCWLDSDGKQVAVLSTKSRTTAQMKALGYKMVGRFKKHKYVMHIRKDSL